MENNMKKIILLYILLFTSLGIFAQQQSQSANVAGVVYDDMNEPFIGVTVSVKNKPGVGMSTDLDGSFKMKVNLGDVLLFTMVGYKPQEYLILKEETNIKIQMELAEHQLTEAVVTGMGSTQRRISIVGAVTTVDAKELQTPATSLANMLGGRVPGVISMQRSGEPGQNTSEFWVRGVGTYGGGASALVLIDGLEGSIDNIDPADIEDIAVLKDASATAVYGVRGANGVVLVTTKKGTADKLSITFRSNVTLSYLNRLPNYLGAYDYANMANEAKVVRGEERLYNDTELYIIKHGLDSDLYPDVNWREEILKRTSLQHTYYINARGGGSIATYFISLGYSTEGSAYKQDKNSKYSSGVGYDKYTYRTNLDINLTKTTQLRFGVDGEFTNKTEPAMKAGAVKDRNYTVTDELWEAQQKLTPLIMPTRYSTGEFPASGESESGTYSPYVMLNHTGKANREYSKNLITLALNQDLSPLLKGLTFRAQGAITTVGYQNEERFLRPALYYATSRRQNGELVMAEKRKKESTQYNNWQRQSRKIHLESTVNYETIFNDDHRFSLLGYYYMSDEKITTESNSSSLQALPYKYQGISGRVTYGFKDTYFIDGNFGYTGSANFKKGQRFGFFPAVAVGWVPTNYEIVRNGLPWLDFFKIRFSYGLVGNDKISGTSRFPYLTVIDENASTGWGFGETGIKEKTIGAENLKWEKAKKADLGIEGRLFNERVQFVVDLFNDQRDGIFLQRTQIPSYVGLVNMPYGNVGRMRSWGSDGNISYMHTFNKDFALTLRANYTYSTNKVQEREEAQQNYPYLYNKNWPNEVQRGYIALGLFEDEADIANSPTQSFGGKIMPGDIKYKDVNGDGVINSQDRVPISYNRIPRLMYGLGIEGVYKKFTLGIRFTGTGNTDFSWMAEGGMGYIPFVQGMYGNVLDIANKTENRWIPASYSGTKATENPNARFPRLSYGNNQNNSQVSTFWKGNAKYFRLSEVHFNYKLTLEALKKIGIGSMDISLTGTNLLVWDNVKIYDPELAYKGGQAYPIPARFTAQLFINF